MMDERIICIPGWKAIRVIGKDDFSVIYEIQKDDRYGRGIRSALKVVSIPQTSFQMKEYLDNGYDDISLEVLFKDTVEDVVAGFELLHRLKGHGNIISYEDYTIVQHEDDPGSDVCIRMELLPSLLEYKEGGRISEKTVIQLGIDICNALEACESQHIVYWNIRPNHIYISENGGFKLGGFRMAKSELVSTKAIQTGFRTFLSPEVYYSKPYNASVSTYSLGLILYWILNERRGPFLPLPPSAPTFNQVNEAENRRINGEALPEPAHGGEELKRIVMKACAFEQKDRYANPADMKRDLQTVINSVQDIPFVSARSDKELTDDFHQKEETVRIFAGKTEKKQKAAFSLPVNPQPKNADISQSKAGNKDNSESKANSVDTDGTVNSENRQTVTEKDAAAGPGRRRGAGFASHLRTVLKNRKIIWIAVAVLVAVAAIIVGLVFLYRTKCAQTESGSSINMHENTETVSEPEDNVTTISEANVGDYISLGEYEQDNDETNGQEPIIWLVLTKENNRILVISKNALDSYPYHSQEIDITWENSSLRTWLNTAFIENAFSASEKAMIETTQVKAERNTAFDTDPGEDTEDKVFLLSIQEASRYFASNGARQCKPTQFAVANRAWASDNNGCCWWWLRSQGFSSTWAAFVDADGEIKGSGYAVHKEHYAVRPAVWIDING